MNEAQLTFLEVRDSGKVRYHWGRVMCRVYYVRPAPGPPSPLLCGGELLSSSTLYLQQIKKRESIFKQALAVKGLASSQFSYTITGDINSIVKDKLFVFSIVHQQYTNNFLVE